jgi:hypothetical protein
LPKKEKEDRWAKPTTINDITLAFPANILELMPSREECKAGLAALSETKRNKWLDFQRRWFHEGLPADIKFFMKDGIDGESMIRHLQAIQGSFAPKHEHKVEAVAYLASQWIERIEGL